MTPPTLRTERLRLRALRHTDADDICRIAGDYAVSKWLVPVPHPYTRADAVAFLALDREGTLGENWAIELGGKLVGVIGVDPSIGYYIAPDFQRQGIACEAVRAVLSYHFDRTEDDAITCHYFIGNEGSKRVLEQAGFVDIGPYESYSQARAEPVASRQMRLTRQAWHAAAHPAPVSYRPLKSTDFDAHHALVSQWEVVRNLGSWPWPPDQAFTRKRCQPYAGAGFVWAICLRDRLIGTVAITQGELGYMLHPDHHGQGIITRAICDALHEGFEVLGFEHISADIWADNTASRYLLQKAGFVRTVQEVVHALARDVPTASETYVLRREAWLPLSDAS